MAERLFICYAHADSDRVLDRLSWLEDAGFEPWFDEHITGGTVWRDTISDAIEGSAALLFFVSPRSIESERCRDEVDFALELDVPVLTVHIEETTLPNRLLFRLSNRQAVLGHRLTEEAYRERLTQAVEAATRSGPAEFTRTSDGQRKTRVERLVVLPFRNTTGDPGHEFFCDGLTEETIGTLGREHGDQLGVIARASSMQYKGVTKPISEIATELGVDYVLEGSARHGGNRVRVSVSLVSAADETQIWSDVYDREVVDAFEVQDDIARGVARSLEIAVVSAERPGSTRVTSAATAAARDAYLKGRVYYYHAAAADYPIAKAYFEEAIRQDPEFAPAYVGLADTIATPGHRGDVPPYEVYPEAKRLVAKALALDDRSAEAHDLHARIAFAHDFEAGEAERHFKRAIELNPSYPDAHVIYAQVLATTGRRDRALASLQRGLDLDPHNVFFQINLVLQLGGAGRCDEAIDVLDRLPPGIGFADEMGWGACYRAERFRDALRHFGSYLAEDDDVQSVLSGQDQGEITGADYRAVMERAANVLVARSKSAYVSPFRIARVYTHAERFEAALEWLHKAVDIHDSYVVYSALMADYHKLWGRPGFAELRARMDLAT